MRRKRNATDWELVWVGTEEGDERTSEGEPYPHVGDGSCARVFARCQCSVQASSAATDVAWRVG